LLRRKGKGREKEKSEGGPVSGRLLTQALAQESAGKKSKGLEGQRSGD